MNSINKLILYTYYSHNKFSNEMEVNMEPSWKKVLEQEFEKDYFIQLMSFVTKEYQTKTIFPKKELLFNAFNLCPFKQTKVVVVGQDPYHGVGQANGLCFSANDDIAHPPSLINIFKELESDLAIPSPKSGNIERWAKQGVLLLNAVLTIQSGKAGSHQNKGWETFTDAVIKTISEQNNNIVFLLWGSYAIKKGAIIDTTKHLVLTSGHPSPLSANRGLWFGNKHFSKCNGYLRKIGKTAIEW